MNKTQLSYANYLWIWMGLIALLLAGTAVSSLSIPKTSIVLILLTISLAKMILVTLFYMHLKFERIIPIWVVAISPFFLIGLASLLVVLGISLG